MHGVKLSGGSGFHRFLVYLIKVLTRTYHGSVEIEGIGHKGGELLYNMTSDMNSQPLQYVSLH